MGPIHEGFTGKAASLAGFVINAAGAGLRHCDGLFDEDVLAGPQTLDGPFDMVDVGCRDIDDIHIRASQEHVIAVLDTGAGKILGKARPIGVAATYGDQPAGLRFRDGSGKGLGLCRRGQ